MFVRNTFSIAKQKVVFLSFAQSLSLSLLLRGVLFVFILCFVAPSLPGIPLFVLHII